MRYLTVKRKEMVKLFVPVTGYSKTYVGLHFPNSKGKDSGPICPVDPRSFKEDPFVFTGPLHHVYVGLFLSR
jgi:hypothetical protein